MGRMGIHDPDALHLFGCVIYCPWDSSQPPADHSLLARPGV